MGKFFKVVFFIIVGLTIFGYFIDQRSAGTGPVASLTPKKEALAKLELSNLRVRKDGFGTVMLIDARLSNANDFPVKDVEITCTHFANSGSKIDSNTRTLFERVEAGRSVSLNEFNMGFMRDQVATSQCAVSGFGKI